MLPSHVGVCHEGVAQRLASSSRSCAWTKRAACRRDVLRGRLRPVGAGGARRARTASPRSRRKSRGAGASARPTGGPSRPWRASVPKLAPQAQPRATPHLALTCSRTMPPTLLRDARRLPRAPATTRARAAARVGLVPTMGALHEGHLALVREARAARAASSSSSIFVNPTQFGPNEDLARYPRDLDGDVAQARERRAPTLVFAPDAAAMYPPGDETRVRVGALAAPLCGRAPAGALRGGRDGRREALRARRAVRRRVRAEGLPAAAVVRRIATRPLFSRRDRRPPHRARAGRPRDELAQRLPLGRRARARALAIVARPRRRGAGASRAGERDARDARARRARAHRARSPTSIDYVDVARRRTRSRRSRRRTIGDARARWPSPAAIGTTRLIDNVVLGEDPAPRGATAWRPRPASCAIAVPHDSSADGSWCSRGSTARGRRRRSRAWPTAARGAASRARDARAERRAGRDARAPGAHGAHRRPRRARAGLGDDGAPLRRRPDGPRRERDRAVRRRAAAS